MLGDEKREDSLIILFLSLIISVTITVFGFAWYVSTSAEKRCISGAEKVGNVSEEIRDWCRDTF